MHVGLVVSRFNAEVTEQLERSCLETLQAQGVDEANITLVSVPGALEIPLALAQMAETGRFDALIALGAVIRGETYHFEVVSLESAAGISRVALEFHLPIANAVLTTENEEQALARAQQKGRDAAMVALEMADLIFSIDDQFGEDRDEH